MYSFDKIEHRKMHCFINVSLIKKYSQELHIDLFALETKYIELVHATSELK